MSDKISELRMIGTSCAALTTTRDWSSIVIANSSLPQDKLTDFRPISTSAVRILARLAARKAVTEGLRSEGVRVSLVPPREINAKAQAYLADHPELYRQALERAQRMGMYEKRKLLPVMITPERNSCIE